MMAPFSDHRYVMVNNPMRHNHGSGKKYATLPAAVPLLSSPCGSGFAYAALDCLPKH
jgi:hypothetical protein